MVDPRTADDGGTPIEFRPSATAQVVPEGPRDVALVFLGASLVSGVGDPKGQGWVTRVVGRTQHPDLELTAYNLGVRGNTTADLLERWATEVPLRWAGRTDGRSQADVPELTGDDAHLSACHLPETERRRIWADEITPAGVAR